MRGQLRVGRARPFLRVVKLCTLPVSICLSDDDSKVPSVIRPLCSIFDVKLDGLSCSKLDCCCYASDCSQVAWECRSCMRQGELIQGQGTAKMWAHSVAYQSSSRTYLILPITQQQPALQLLQVSSPPAPATILYMCRSRSSTTLTQVT